MKITVQFLTALIAISTQFAHAEDTVNSKKSTDVEGINYNNVDSQINSLKTEKSSSMLDLKQVLLRTEIVDGDLPSVCGNEDEGSPMDEFPEIFSPEQLRNGAIILHVIGAIYFFTLLAIICNDYFLPTVECICDDLNLSKDVAAATFMATATSMPEFFTNTISTLITQSDMGLGTIIGSLMFNTLGVAALSACAVSKPIQLDWWPVIRDCVIYSFNTILLIFVSWGGVITFTDSLIMVIFLILYYLFMFTNNKMMRIVRVFVEDKMNCCVSTRYDLTLPPEYSARAKLPLTKEDIKGNGIFVISRADNTSSISSTEQLTYSKKWIDDDDDDSVDIPASLFEIPKGGYVQKCWFFYSWPIKALLSCLIPNPITNRKWYPLTFINCIVLIGINAYVIVWMLTTFGVTIGVSEIVMGLTFLAAGATMPEAVSSLISIRKGESGIGVSNSLGANSLAILLSLGVPWFIKNCINYNQPEGLNVVHINSQGIEYTIGILLCSTFALFVILNFSGFRLSRTVGISLFVVYGVFITLQILIEMNVFFPRSC